MIKKNISITTTPFDLKNLAILEKSGFNVSINPYGRRIKEEEVFDFVKNADGIIAGTERYDKSLLSKLEKLQVISRVGIGVDNIDLDFVKDQGVKVFNTPDQPADAVAEYCLGVTISLIRDIFFSNERLFKGEWKRDLGLSLGEVSIGLIGGGRVAKKFKDLLQNCGVKEIKVFDVVDLREDIDWKADNIKIVEIEEIKTCDVISLHVPLNDKTHHLLDEKFLNSLKNKSFIINSSRGEIIDEVALIKALDEDKIRGAAIDVFKVEPYEGPLLGIRKLITTPHIASSSKGVRFLMEEESCMNLVGYFKDE